MNTAKQFVRNRQAVTWTVLLFPLPLGIYFFGKTCAASQLRSRRHSVTIALSFWAKELTREELNQKFPDSEVLARHQVHPLSAPPLP